MWRVAGAGWLACIGPAAAQDAVQRGEYLVHAGGCVSCHTAPGGTPFAGGRALTTPFGTFYSPNITPDAETGNRPLDRCAVPACVARGRAAGWRQLLSGVPVSEFHQHQRCGCAGDQGVSVLVADRCGRRTGAHDVALPFSWRFLQTGWKTAVLSRGAVPRRSVARCSVQPRRLSGHGAGALRRMPHAAQPARRGETEPGAVRERAMDRMAKRCRTSRRIVPPASVQWDSDDIVTLLKTGRTPEESGGEGRDARGRAGWAEVPDRCRSCRRSLRICCRSSRLRTRLAGEGQYTPSTTRYTATASGKP